MHAHLPSFLPTHLHLPPHLPSCIHTYLPSVRVLGGRCQTRMLLYLLFIGIRTLLLAGARFGAALLVANQRRNGAQGEVGSMRVCLLWLVFRCCLWLAFWC